MALLRVPQGGLKHVSRQDVHLHIFEVSSPTVFLTLLISPFLLTGTYNFLGTDLSENECNKLLVISYTS